MSESSKTPPFPKCILIGGMPRSGTTAYVECLCDSFDIEALPETHFLNILNETGRFDMNRLPKMTSARAEIADLLTDFQAQGKTDFLTFVDELAERLGLHSNCLVEKTPSHVMEMHRVPLSSNILKLVVVRGCADTCISLGRVDWNTASPLRNALRWARFGLRTWQLARRGDVAILLHKNLLSNRPQLINAIQDGFGLVPRALPRDSTSFDLDAEPWKKGASQKDYKAAPSIEKLPLFAKLTSCVCDQTIYRLLAWQAPNSIERHQTRRVKINAE